MAIGYARKNDLDLTWVENREGVILKGRQLQRRVMNEALAQLDQIFKEKIQQGEIYNYEISKTELKKLIIEATKTALGDASD